MCATPKSFSKKLHRSQNQGMKTKLNNSLDTKRKQIRHKKRKVSFCSQVIIVDSVIEDLQGIKSNQEIQSTDSGSYAYDTWYSLSELEEMKETVKEEAKKYRVLSSKAISSSPTQSSLVLPFRNCGVYKKMKYLVKVQEILNDDSDSSSSTSTKNIPEFRGLEGRIFIERQRNKAMAMNTVMEYQRRTQILIDEARKNKKSESEIRLMKEQFATRLSTICSQLSQWSLDEALAAARYDAEGIFALPCSQSSNNENEMMKVARQTSKSSSSKRKLSPLNSNNNLSIWEQHQRQIKQPRLSMDNIYVSS
mmetsp:Transcript_13596/g.17168  ORF Transcript_13596/g.17168 Transcript_13596/m.17168 type:complete len:307 (-) Transcript_13596:92-1012(-)